MAGGGEVARRGLLGYQRSEEATADRSAIKYLEATGQSAKGMLETFERFQSALSLSGTRVDPYQVSHPMPRDRIANLETLAKRARTTTPRISEALQQRHDMMRAKIAVYHAGPGRGLPAVPQGCPQAWPPQYGDAQATFSSAIRERAEEGRRADQGAAEEPVFPRIARRHPAAGRTSPKEAAEAYARAVSSIRRSRAYCRFAYGQALIATGNRES